VPEEITALQFLDRYDHAQALLDQARAERPRPAVLGAQMWQDFNLCRLDEADAGALALIELGRELGTHLHTLEAITIRTSVALMRGDAETAAAQLRHADQMTTVDEQLRTPGIRAGWP
jgi:hypothetical protein